MFETASLENSLKLLQHLEASTTPKWGSMSAQGMVEHITDTLIMAKGEVPTELLIPEDKIEKMQQFLYSDKEMLRNIEVPFAPKNRTLRNDDLDDAIDEFTEAWISFEERFEDNKNLETLHPFYGMLNFEKWLLLHKKHITHHFKQFSLIAEK